MFRAYVVRQITGSGQKWEGALNVRGGNGENGMTKIGTIVLPGTTYFNRFALKKLLAINSADFLDREGYRDHAIFLPVGQIKREDLELVIGTNQNGIPIVDDAFWGRVEKGLPSRVPPETELAIISEVNKYPEVGGVGKEFSVGANGKVYQKQKPSTLESK